VRAQLTFATSGGSVAGPLLLKAAQRLAPIDVGLARATYMDALVAAFFAGRLASPGGSLLDVALAAGTAPAPPHPPRAPDLLLDGLAERFSRGYAAGVPILRRALQAFCNGMPPDPGLRWLSLACGAAFHLWDDQSWAMLSDRYVRLARETGALGELPVALPQRVYALLFTGELTAAAAAAEEMHAAIEATGSKIAPYGALALAAFRGSEAEASVLTEATLRDVSARGEGFGISAVGWAGAVLNNGLGRYTEALTAARQASDSHPELGQSNWAMSELIEAATRSGMTETAVGAYRRLAEMTSASGTDWGLGIEARSRALLSEGEEAERLYREAIERLDRTCVRAELARAHLLYGEWLRRGRRRGEAREQLRTAHGMLEAMGMEGFAARARRELRATGDAVRRRVVATGDGELTAQEVQIARLARDGLSNPEIATRLFLSPRTVQYHLGKVFTKLDITSRRQLRRILPAAADTAPPR
jgi:DNA-binding CsgD family transcriptional regulator